jgi:hypothetical protein
VPRRWNALTAIVHAATVRDTDQRGVSRGSLDQIGNRLRSFGSGLACSRALLARTAL